MRHLLATRRIDAGAQNDEKETALHYLLRYGRTKRIKGALLLMKYTDLTLKDSQMKEPHKIVLLEKNESRLSELLEMMYTRQLAGKDKND